MPVLDYLNYSRKLHEKFNKWMKEAAREFMNAALAKIPVRTGFLAGSFTNLRELVGGGTQGNPANAAVYKARKLKLLRKRLEKITQRRQEAFARSQLHKQQHTESEHASKIGKVDKRKIKKQILEDDETEKGKERAAALTPAQRKELSQRLRALKQSEKRRQFAYVREQRRREVEGLQLQHEEKAIKDAIFKLDKSLGKRPKLSKSERADIKESPDKSLKGSTAGTSKESLLGTLHGLSKLLRGSAPYNPKAEDIHQGRGKYTTTVSYKQKKNPAYDAHHAAIEKHIKTHNLTGAKAIIYRQTQKKHEPPEFIRGRKKLGLELTHKRLSFFKERYYHYKGAPGIIKTPRSGLKFATDPKFIFSEGTFKEGKPKDGQDLKTTTYANDERKRTEDQTSEALKNTSNILSELDNRTQAILNQAVVHYKFYYAISINYFAPSDLGKSRSPASPWGSMQAGIKAFEKYLQSKISQIPQFNDFLYTKKYTIKGDGSDTTTVQLLKAHNALK